MLKVLELFAGIGACSKALENLEIEINYADVVEIDKYAIKSFNAIHNTNFETQDIKQWNKPINDIDLIMHGSPCQDFSVAGKQAGADVGSGTRSSLMYETIRIVEQTKPKYIIWENVKNILSKKHKHNFDNYIETMNQLGYNNYYQILNAKDYGIPQNRERVYTISIRKDIDNKQFKFPKKEKLKIRLKDILEAEVDEKYYLSEKMIKCISVTGTKTFKNNDSKINLEIARPLTSTMSKMHRAGTDNYISENFPTEYDLSLYIVNCTKQGYQEATTGDSINLSYPKSKTRRGRVGKQIAQTLTAKDNMAVLEAPYIVASRGRNPENPSSRIAGEHLEQRLEANTNGTTNCISTVQKDNYVVENNIKIRKLTPLECWRLMGFSDEDFKKAEKVNSNAQLYKQAGNSIVVKVLEKIFKNLFREERKIK